MEEARGVNRRGHDRKRVRKTVLAYVEDMKGNRHEADYEAGFFFKRGCDSFRAPEIRQGTHTGSSDAEASCQAANASLAQLP